MTVANAHYTRVLTRTNIKILQQIQALILYYTNSCYSIKSSNTIVHAYTFTYYCANN